MRRFAALLLALLASAASAQNVTVIGPVTPGNVPVFNSTTVIKDSGLPPSSGGAVNWINVKQAPCNAVGNGVADDTSAINTCIAAFNTATNGTLYFPAGTYKTSTALTPVTANGVIRGDGITSMAGQLGNNAGAVPKYTGVAPLPATVIQSTSQTAALFTINSQALLFTNLTLQNTFAGTPSAGSAGIVATSTNVSQKVDYQNIEVAFFYIDIDVQTGNAWSMVNVFCADPVLYGIKVRNIVDPDYGDWAIVNTMILSLNRSPTDGIRIESSGGGKISNFKILAGPSGTTTSTWVNGIEVAASGNTVDLFITNGSIEVFSDSGIKITGSWPNVSISGVEIGFGAPTHLISASNTSNLYISGIMLPSASATPSGTPILLSSCTNCYVSNLVNISNPYSGGTVADHDGTGGQGGIYTTYSTAAGSGLTTSVPNSPNFNFVNALTLFAPNANSAGNNTSLNIGVNSGNGNDVSQYFTFQGNNSPNNGFSTQFSFAANPDLTMLLNGHVAFPGGGGAAPTLTAGCNGTGQVISGNDTNGTITGQNTASTSCTLTFGTAYAAVPNCTVSGLSSPLTGAVTVGTGSIVVNFASTANYKWSYHCHGT